MNTRRFQLYIAVMGLCSAFLAAAITSPVHASSDDAAAKAGPMAAENVQRGEKLFNSSCAFCHGPAAKGTSTGPSLIDSSEVRHDKDGDLIGTTVREGRVDKGMPAFPIFDKNQVADLVAFLHARVALSDSVETAGPAGGYQLQRLLTGNAAAGKAYFDGAGGCAKCHSPKGDLAGVAKKYQPSELEARFLYPKGVRPSVTITLPSGKKVQGTLMHHDAFYVAIVDAEGKYHSWPLPGVKVDTNDPLSGHLALLDKYTNKDVHDVFAYLETLK